MRYRDEKGRFISKATAEDRAARSRVAAIIALMALSAVAFAALAVVLPTL